MTEYTTRAERIEAEEEAPSTRPLATGRFWADLAERVVTSAAGGALAVATAGGFGLLDASSWEALAVGAGAAALLSILKGLAAAGSGSPSLAPGV